MSERDKNQRHPALAIMFIITIVVAGLIIGFLTPPDEWYQSLIKPSFNPPGWVFAPVWTALYIIIAVAGWRIWCIAPRSTAMKLWIAQTVLNWLWSPMFFGVKAPWLALVTIVAMLATIIAFILQARKHDRTSAALFVPYLGWVAFATMLNGSIALLN